LTPKILADPSPYRASEIVAVPTDPGQIPRPSARRARSNMRLVRRPRGHRWPSAPNPLARIGIEVPLPMGRLTLRPWDAINTSLKGQGCRGQLLPNAGAA